MGLVPTHIAEQMLLLESQMQPTLHSHGPQVRMWEKPAHRPVSHLRHIPQGSPSPMKP